MYETFYGFKEKPFNLHPDPEYFFMSREHGETYTQLEYAITENKGFVVITGEIGSGKTTLINYLLRRLRPDIEVAVLNHTIVRPKQFIKMLCQEFELSSDGMDKTELLDLFYDFLLEQFAARKRVVLIIDESQNLPEKTLEEIRLLSNLESEKNHLLQIILLGQPELKHKLEQKNLEQFVQRVTVYWHLKGLNQDEVGQYIRHRLRVAGSGDNSKIFNSEAVDALYTHSKGIPRLINIFCDAALVYGYADESKIIGKDTIEEVVKIRNIGEITPEDKDKASKSNINRIRNEDLRQLYTTMKRIEKKVDLLEAMLESFNSGIETFPPTLEGLSASDSQRDEIIYDSTQNLNESVKNNVNLLGEIKQSKVTDKEIKQKRAIIIWSAAIAFGVFCGALIAIHYLYMPLDTVTMKIQKALMVDR
jgi:general secretion pathway protein A